MESGFFVFNDGGVKFSGFPELRSVLENRWKATFGDDIDLSPTSPDGHHVDLEARTISSVLEGLELITSGMNRQQATGLFLEFLAAFLKLSRNPGESDASLRRRMDEAESDGRCTFDAMYTYLKEHIGPDIAVALNDGSEYVDGMPPHSFRVTVPTENETSNDDIAKFVWLCKPGGIETCGNSSGTTKDASGRLRVVNFSRPSRFPFDIRVELSLYTEETFPSEGKEIVKSRIRDWCNGEGLWNLPAYNPGTDIMPIRIIVPVLSVSGIAGAKIYVRTTKNNEWTTDTISVNSEQKADVNEIEVFVV